MTVGRIPVIEGGIQPTIFDAKADLLTATANDTPARLAVGTNGQVLTADSTTGTGLKWAASSTPSFKGCRLFNTATISVANNTATALTYNSESFDTDSFHSTSSNTSRITIPAGLGGKYSVFAIIEYPANTTGSREIQIRINGSVAGQTIVDYQNFSSGAFYQKTAGIMELTAGDYIELWVLQSSGVSLNIALSQSYCQFSVQYLGA
jgi:hypothetical protein